MDEGPSVGYSKTPLAQKLGLKPGMRLACIGAPTEYEATALAPLPEGAWIVPWQAEGRYELVQFFCAWRADLERHLPKVIATMEPRAAIWISWPKKAAKLPGDLDENILREVVLPTGWVDVKVCAVDANWSGLKFLRRKDKTP